MRYVTLCALLCLLFCGCGDDWEAWEPRPYVNTSTTSSVVTTSYGYVVNTTGHSTYYGRGTTTAKAGDTVRMLVNGDQIQSLTVITPASR